MWNLKESPIVNLLCKRNLQCYTHLVHFLFFSFFSMVVRRFRRFKSLRSPCQYFDLMSDLIQVDKVLFPFTSQYGPLTREPGKRKECLKYNDRVCQCGKSSQLRVLRLQKKVCHRRKTSVLEFFFFFSKKFFFYIWIQTDLEFTVQRRNIQKK